VDGTSRPDAANAQVFLEVHFSGHARIDAHPIPSRPTWAQQTYMGCFLPFQERKKEPNKKHQRSCKSIPRLQAKEGSGNSRLALAITTLAPVQAMAVSEISLARAAVNTSTSTLSTLVYPVIAVMAVRVGCFSHTLWCGYM
jgi:hypothetical protein